ncbi:MAG: DUF4625 domain-containing protein [Bacteroidales bacterium]|jgi:hypothetical protein|nr:DUF4625 domain-containing protein [Bacteroidales bacterium]
MKTKFNFYNLYLVCLTAISFAAFSSCDHGDNGDTTKPVINLIEPEEGDVLKIGDEQGVHLEMELSDDVMLKSYKVDIHPNFDGHAHAHSATLKPASETVDFTFQQTWDESGKKNDHVHHHDIKIPANATPGDYHLMVYCTDAAGNEAYLARNVVLSTEGGEEHVHED